MNTLFSSEINSVVLLSLGSLGALVNAMSFQVIRRFDEDPAGSLSAQFAARLRRRLEKRRRNFPVKWLTAIVMGITAATIGNFLRVPDVANYKTALTASGYAAVTVSLTLGVLIIREYVVLSRLTRELPQRFDEGDRKKKLLRRLEKV